MPTTLTHTLVGLGMAEVFAGHRLPPGFYALSAALALLPDLDVIAFRLGIPYGSRFGHRGFSHSLVCAAAVALAIGFLGPSWLGVSCWLLAAFAFAVVVAHSLLDAQTDGGMGIAFFSPFDDRRYFLPWQPIRVSPIGLRVFSRWGLHALTSEVVWVWLPMTLLIVSAALVRALAA